MEHLKLRLMEMSWRESSSIDLEFLFPFGYKDMTTDIFK